MKFRLPDISFFILPAICYVFAGYLAVVNPALQKDFMNITMVGISGYAGFLTQNIIIGTGVKDNEDDSLPSDKTNQDP